MEKLYLFKNMNSYIETFPKNLEMSFFFCSVNSELYFENQLVCYCKPDYE